MAKSPFVPVNELLERTTLQQFVTHYNFNTEIQQSGNEERIRSPFACEKCQGNGKALSVNWQSGVFISHCYHCNVRGRVTTLLFGMKHGRKDTIQKLSKHAFVRLIWEPDCNAGKLRGMQPEQLTSASLLELFKAS